eukprot:3000-Heterococcus_DN1.PRE.3
MTCGDLRLYTDVYAQAGGSIACSTIPDVVYVAALLRPACCAMFVAAVASVAACECSCDVPEARNQ